MKKKNIFKNFSSEFSKIKSGTIIDYIKKPNIQALGNEELFIEGIIRILKYTRCEITVCANSLVISVSGEFLEMRFYTKTSIKVIGEISCIKLNYDNKE